MPCGSAVQDAWVAVRLAEGAEGAGDEPDDGGGASQEGCAKGLSQ